MDSKETMGAVISKTYSKMKNSLAKELKPHQVTHEQWSLLIKLFKQDGVSQKELSERCFKDQPTTARILDKLEKRGLIYRRGHPSDKRVFLIYLTGEGRNIMTTLIPLSYKHMENALKGLSEQDQELLKILLNRIIENLD